MLTGVMLLTGLAEKIILAKLEIGVEVHEQSTEDRPG